MLASQKMYKVMWPRDPNSSSELPVYQLSGNMLYFLISVTKQATVNSAANYIKPPSEERL